MLVRSIKWSKQARRSLHEGASEVDSSEDENSADPNITIDLYLKEIVDALLEDYEIAEEDAFEFVLDAADAISEEGVMPPLPSQEASYEELVAWYGHATTQGFKSLVLKLAKEQAV